MKITVTEEHIKNGIRADCQRCPVALALSSAGLSGFWVGGRVAFNPATDQDINLPDAVVQAILDYDIDKAPMVPFEFEIPDGVL